MSRYCQCQLEKEDGFIITYIPEKYAKVGKVLKLKRGEAWDDGWEVKRVFGCADEPPHAKRAIRQHRKRTGDSLPKREPEK